MPNGPANGPPNGPPNSPSYDIIFNPDGSMLLPDLPQELVPAVTALGFTRPAPAVIGTASAGPGRGSRGRPNWQQAKALRLPLAGPALETAETGLLWELHEQALKSRKAQEIESRSGGASLLDLKTELARRALVNCQLCELRCGANRWAGHSGACGSDREAYYGRCFLNWSEEKHLIPGIMVYLNGCNWACVYCQYPDHLTAKAGKVLEPEALAGEIERLRQAGGVNIHWVGGNPDQSLWAVLRTLQACQANLPIVWNSNGYTSSEALRLLEGVVDAYLVDFRYWEEACARRYGAAPHSRETIQRNLGLIAGQADELIVRHLQLPGHFECCTRPILEWLAAHLPETALNLMNGQYHPAHHAYRYPEINRRLTPAERQAADRLAASLGIKLIS